MKQNLNLRINNSGVTLIELLTTITISGFVAIMILSTYLFAHKLYIRKDVRTDLLSMALVIEKKLEKETGESDSVNVENTENLIFFKHQKGIDSLVILEDSFIYKGKETPMNESKLEIIRVTVHPRLGYMNTSLVEWQARLSKKGEILEWIGGTRTGIF
jgi:hypothetical protein